MKAQVIQADKTIKIEQKQVPTIGDDEVLVKVTAVAQNPTDWKHVEYMTVPNAICGCEFAGHIVKVGKSVTRVSVGDLVSGSNHGSAYPDKGSFAEYVNALEDLVWKVPEGLSAEQAAGMNVGPLTVVQSFYSPKNLGLPIPPAKVEGDQWILIYGGSSSVGMYAIQIAKISGFKVATTSSPRNFELVKSLGADAVFDYRDTDVVSKIKATTNDSIHIALDTISTADSQLLTVNAFAPGPGKLHLILVPSPPAQKVREDVKFTMSLLYSAFGVAFGFANGVSFPAAPEDRAFIRDWLAGPGIRLLNEGKIKPNPIKVLPGGLEGIPAGFEYMKAGKNSAEKLVFKLE
ncbi:zinc-binding oxidoreductase ToxD [Irpex rosettiformis]|uniref:Zinc-binding oxidoreductase ToxD n=1 Tax=Irpex rosettiformis TaxID=378272 RepID=A0ACB8U4H8_9APHY|nr:zinc-binding oxidoreductase ToxD [Irpex rosettiformis]